jgi:hypothetical protein
LEVFDVDTLTGMVTVKFIEDVKSVIVDGLDVSEVAIAKY